MNKQYLISLKSGSKFMIEKQLDREALISAFNNNPQGWVEEVDFAFKISEIESISENPYKK